MIVPFLITFREIIEASIIVTTVLGILTKLHRKNQRRTVWIAAASALGASFILVFTGSTVGMNIKSIITSPRWEGATLICSSLFVTWAVFSLHKQFAHGKMVLLSRMQQSLTRDGIFLFTFVSVLREGIEIALFLSSVYLTSNPAAILSGFALGAAAGAGISILFFRAVLKLPVYVAFKGTSYLLILFAGGMFGKGLGELLREGAVFSFANVPLLASLLFIFILHRRVFVHSR